MRVDGEEDCFPESFLDFVETLDIVCIALQPIVTSLNVIFHL